MPRWGMRDVVVLLPGIMGSVLKKDGQVVWGYSAKTIVKALFTLGGSLEKNLALPHDDPDADDLGDGIVADGLMPDLHLLPGLWKIDGYGKITEAIKANFAVTEGANFFPFPYDWRRDNRAAAGKLARSTHAWLTAWRKASGNEHAKLILVAHSMGGLVARHFLECMDGWKDTRALVTFGTPYRGSLNALDGLCNGLKKGPLDLSALARQFTALYQLLPTFKCYDAGDGNLVRVGETSNIPHVDAGKAAAALKFHDDIKAAVKSNSQLPQYQSSGYHIHPVVGIEQMTELSARRAPTGVELLQTYKGEALGGDGTVPRFSAIPFELNDDASAAMYAGTQHGSLQNAAAVITHLTGILSGTNLDLGEFLRPPTQVALAQVALEVEDVYFAGESVVVRARPNRDGVELHATLSREDDGQPAATLDMTPAGDGWLHADFALPAEGAYRVAITGTNVATAEDSLLVADVGS